MSSDNYILIRKDMAGKYVCCMGFASDPRSDWNEDDPNYPPITASDKRCDDMGEASATAYEDWTEYGVITHGECGHENVSAIARFDYDHGGWRFREADGNRTTTDEEVVVNGWWLKEYLKALNRLDALEAGMVQQAMLNPRRPYRADDTRRGLTTP